MFTIGQPFQKNYNKRGAHFAIWGPDRLNPRGRVASNVGTAVTPHVVIQFSCCCGGSSLEDEETTALEDMSLYSGRGNDYEALGTPKVLYLIQAIHPSNGASSSPAVQYHGFDVYQIRPGQRLMEGPPTLIYRVGGDEDVTIKVAAEDLGLPLTMGSFSLALAGIRASMEEVNVVFEAEHEE